RTTTVPTFSLLLFTTSSCMAFTNRLLHQSPTSPIAYFTNRLLHQSPITRSPMLFLAFFRFLHLRHLDLLRGHRLANDHIAHRRAGYAALDENQVIVAVDAQHFQIACGHLLAAHPARRAHPLDHTRRKRRGADRSRRAVEHRSVRRRAAAEMVAPD